MRRAFLFRADRTRPVHMGRRGGAMRVASQLFSSHSLPFPLFLFFSLRLCALSLLLSSSLSLPPLAGSCKLASRWACGCISAREEGVQRWRGPSLAFDPGLNLRCFGGAPFAWRIPNTGRGTVSAVATTGRAVPVLFAGIAPRVNMSSWVTGGWFRQGATEGLLRPWHSCPAYVWVLYIFDSTSMCGCTR